MWPGSQERQKLEQRCFLSAPLISIGVVMTRRQGCLLCMRKYGSSFNLNIKQQHFQRWSYLKMFLFSACKRSAKGTQTSKRSQTRAAAEWAGSRAEVSFRESKHTNKKTAEGTRGVVVKSRWTMWSWSWLKKIIIKSFEGSKRRLSKPLNKNCRYGRTDFGPLVSYFFVLYTFLQPLANILSEILCYVVKNSFTHADLNSKMFITKHIYMCVCAFREKSHPTGLATQRVN